MTLRCSSFDEFAKRIKQEKRNIVLFGAGAIGAVIAPQILSSLCIFEYVDCYLDNDSSKWGKTVNVNGRDINIRPSQYLENCPDDTVVLINISRYVDVIAQLEQMDCTKQMDIYIMPMMLIHNFCEDESKGQPIMDDIPLIPKKIHYMWLGGTALPDNLKKCKESWKKYCPDYVIIEWNENNYDLSKHPYMMQAYEKKAYGFVPDYARLDILYTEGGIYLDTDVELKRTIEHLRYQGAFCGVEKWQIVNFGGMSGAIKGHPMIKKFLDGRKDISFIDSCGRQNRNTCGYYDTQIAINEGYNIDGTTQSINNMNIYGYDYFHPYDYMSGILNETVNTYSIHWFNGGWLDEQSKIANEKTRNEYLSIYEKSII